MILLHLLKQDINIKLFVGLAVVLIPFFLIRFIYRESGRSLKTLSNLLAGLREGDYSINARGDEKDAMGMVLIEANKLVETMREQRLGALEATALLQVVMSEIDVAVFTFDHKGKLRLVNSSGAALLQLPTERLLGSSTDVLELQDLLEGPAVQTVERRFPGGSGRWRISRGSIREKGHPHEILVISDLSRELREEERLAWQRLVRVFSHELNNSLATIKSIAGSLHGIVSEEETPPDMKEDLNRGLEVIGSRAAALDRFLGNFARLTKLPPPQKRDASLRDLVQRVVGLETRMKVSIADSEDVSLHMDPDQIEQVVINLVRNAVDAALENEHPEVTIRWEKEDDYLKLLVTDNGQGLINRDNLFVPFFTTKNKGSGIGLALSRQIIENHEGQIDLQNCAEGTGCEAVVRLGG